MIKKTTSQAAPGPEINTDVTTPTSPAPPASSPVKISFDEFLIQESPTQSPVIRSTPALEPLILEGVQGYKAPPSDRFTAQEANRILNTYAQKYELTKDQTINSIAYWCQSGGYVKSVPNRSLKINSKTEESLEFLRTAVTQVRPNGTVRQLARTLAPTIARVSLNYDYVGHLWKSLSTIRTNIEGADCIFCCEYYYGLDITPKAVNEALAARTLARRSSTSRTKKPAKKKGGSGKRRK